MSDVIFLSPSAPTPNDVVTLTQVCKANLLKNLECRIVDEELCPNQANLVFTSKFSNWLGAPRPKIKTIDLSGDEVLKFETVDYTLGLLAGTVTFGSAIIDQVLATFTFFPFTDAQLTEMVKQSIREISVSIWRPIDPNNIADDYIHIICKRLYTNILKSLLLEAKDFFSVAIAGRTINKSNIVSQMNLIIEQNEKQVRTEFYALRNFNRTNRVNPSVEVSQDIVSDAEVSP